MHDPSHYALLLLKKTKALLLQGGHESVAHFLLTEQGKYGDAADANSHRDEALILAAAGGHTSLVRALLTWHRDPPRVDCQGGRAIVEAARGGHADTVKVLLGWKVPVGGEEVDSGCLDSGQALVAAAESGDHETVQVLLMAYEAWAERNPPPITLSCGRDAAGKATMKGPAKGSEGIFAPLGIVGAIGAACGHGHVALLRFLIEYHLSWDSHKRLHACHSLGKDSSTVGSLPDNAAATVAS